MIRRRRFLKLTTGLGIGATTGCADVSNRAESITIDLEVSTPREAASLSYTVMIESETELGDAILETSTDEHVQQLSETSAEFSGSISAAPQTYDSLTVTARDSDGREATQGVQQYVRKFDVVDDPPLNVGAHVVPFSWEWMNRCIGADVDTGPSLERQGSVPVSPENLTRWIDQMQGHGIARIVVTWGGHPDDNPWEQNFGDLAASPLFNEVTVEPYYWIGRGTWENADDVKEHVVRPRLQTFRDKILRKDNVATYHDRPILTLGNAPRLVSPFHRDIVRTEWGTIEAFVDDWRAQLRVDGIEPFLVVGLAGFPGSYNDRLRELAAPFDAVTTWAGAGVWGEDNQATWGEAFRFVDEMFQAHREFTDEHEMEFIPYVFPGFDDRDNICWGGDRLIPRGTDHLAQLLDLADGYRTTDMINIATWNDWTEGSVIEPGTFRGKEFGTGYLEVVEGFQRTTSDT